MKRRIAIVMAMFLLVGCASTEEKQAINPPESTPQSIAQTMQPESTNSPMEETLEQTTQVQCEADTTPIPSFAPESQAPQTTPTPTPIPTPSPTPKPTPQPTPEPTVQPTEAPIQQTVATNAGAVPFSLVESSGQWCAIDSSDAAYWAVLEHINAMRAQAGLAALAMDSNLSTAAGERCKSFVEGAPFDHSGMTTQSEICASGPISSAAEVCQGWKNSASHYANIMEPSFTRMGVGCWFCSVDGNHYTYWCVTFEQ